MVINTDRAAPAALELSVKSERYTLAAKDLLSTSVELNGSELQVEADGEVPLLAGEPAPPGKLTVAPISITFLALQDANNSRCR